MPDIFVNNNQELQKKSSEELESLEKKPLSSLHDESIDQIKPIAQSSNRTHSIKLLETYCEYPKGIKFKSQKADEEIILFLRRHLITNFSWLIIAFLLCLLPPIIIPLFAYFNVFQITIDQGLYLVFILFYYFIIFSYLFINFLQWFYNIGIVTNVNVLDLDYTEIVNVHVSTTKVAMIEDVSFKQSGFFQTLFNYGDIHIQTAGANANIEFLKVPRPGQAAILIRNLMGRKGGHG